MALQRAAEFMGLGDTKRGATGISEQSRQGVVSMQSPVGCI